jgi:hypothetical protein
VPPAGIRKKQELDFKGRLVAESSHGPVEGQHQVTYPHGSVLVALSARVPRWPDVRRHRDRRLARHNCRSGDDTGRTTPGERFFQASYQSLYLPLGLRNPAFDYLDRYTSPEFEALDLRQLAASRQFWRFIRVLL